VLASESYQKSIILKPVIYGHCTPPP